MRRLKTHAAFLVLVASCGDSAGPDLPLVVDRVELSTTSLTLGPAASQALVATPRAPDGSAVPGRSIAWSSSDDAIVTVSQAGQVTGIAFGLGKITATVDGKSAEAEVAVIPREPAHLAASWRMESFDGHVLPAAYALFYDEPVGDRIIAKVEIRLDSATKTMGGTGLYERRYYFTELHDEVEVLKFLWGDHGRFTLGTTMPVPLTLTSEYIQNLFTPGHVTSNGRLALNEELWVGEARRATVWVKRAAP
jgi:hypothetical protein